MFRRTLAVLLAALLTVWPALSAPAYTNRTENVVIPMNVSTAIANLDALEQQALALTVAVGKLRHQLTDLLTATVWNDMAEALATAMPQLLAGDTSALEKIDTLATNAAVAMKTNASLTTAPPATQSALPAEKKSPPKNIAGSAATLPPSTPSLEIKPAPPAPTTDAAAPTDAEVKTVLDELKPQLQQLTAIEQSINAAQTSIYQYLSQTTDDVALLTAGVMRFFQLSVHIGTRRMVGDAVATSLPDVKNLLDCHGGLMGSHAFFEALQATVDFGNADRQSDALTTLHQQHACLDLRSSVRHEVAYVFALEQLEAQLAQYGVARWYPQVAAANLPIILTLWDGKQWLGPTPFYNWLLLNKTVMITPGFDDPGVLVFDRTIGAMVKLNLCPGKNGDHVPAHERTTAAQYLLAQRPQFARDQNNAALSAARPYEKNVANNGALPLGIDASQSYTPYGIPWSGDGKLLCQHQHFLNVDEVNDKCLQPQLVLDRLTDAQAWGFGNCTVEEFVIAGLRCIQPQTQCDTKPYLSNPNTKSPPVTPIQIASGAKSLLACLVANVQPPKDAVLSCAVQTMHSGTSGDAVSGGGIPVYTPGSRACGLNPLADDPDGGGDDTTAGDDTADSDDTNNDDTTNDDEKNKDKKDPKDDGVTTTISSDGTTKTYNYPNQVIHGGSSAGPQGSEGPSALPKNGIDPGPTDSTQPPQPPSGNSPETPVGPRTPNHNGSGSSNSTGNPSSNNSNASGGQPRNPNAASADAKWPTQQQAPGGPLTVSLPPELEKFTHLPVGNTGGMWAEDLFQKNYGGDFGKLQSDLAKLLKQVRTVFKNPAFRKHLAAKLNQHIKNIGADPILPEQLDHALDLVLNDPALSGAGSLLIVPAEDAVKQLGLNPNNPWPFAAKYFPLAYPQAGYLLPLPLLLTCLPDPKLHGFLAMVITHEMLHAVTHLMVTQGVVPSTFQKSLGGIDTGEHFFIYDGLENYDQFLPPGSDTKGLIKQSAFDPKSFPPGPDGSGQPGTIVVGEVNIMTVGPRVPDNAASHGYRARYPNSATMCADDDFCGSTCTVGQAHASAFNMCIMQSAGAASSPVRNANGNSGVTDPSPLAAVTGGLPACADDGMPPTNDSGGDCKVTDCPADNPECCQKKSGGGAPWAIDPSKTMQQCYAMYCGEGQGSCPCGTAAAPAWFLKNAAAQTPVEQQLRQQRSHDHTTPRQR